MALCMQGEEDKADSEENVKNELDELRAELSDAQTALKKREAEVEAIKSQAESTNREYDRLTEDYQQLQVSVCLIIYQCNTLLQWISSTSSSSCDCLTEVGLSVSAVPSLPVQRLSAL